MKKGVFVEFKEEGTDVLVNGTGYDVITAVYAICDALDKATGKPFLANDILEKVLAERKRPREQPVDEPCIDDVIEKIKEKKPSGLLELLLMMEALTAMKSGEREAFASFHDRFMHEFENRMGHTVKDRTNISDLHQTNKPEFTCSGNRIEWGSGHEDKEVTFLGRHFVSKKGIKVPHQAVETWINDPALCELIGKMLPLFKVGDSYCIIRDSGEVITMEAY